MIFNGSNYKTDLPSEVDEKYAKGLFDLAYQLVDYIKNNPFVDDVIVCEVYYALQSLRDEVKGASYEQSNT